MRVALVTMPWRMSGSPSLQLGLLKSVLVEAGHTVDVHYASLAFAHLLGATRHDALLEAAGARNRLLGEWLFTRAAFGKDVVSAEEYLSAQIGALDGLVNETTESIRELHEVLIPDFIESLADSTDWGQYEMVGFSSTFEQNVASIALSRAIKERYPQITILFGGANVDADMGPALMWSIDWIDVAIAGEADISLPKLAEALAVGGDITQVPGAIVRTPDGIVRGPSPELLKDLNGLPIPDYSEYFDALDRYGREALLGGRRINLVFESSRGCWWGQKHHCTFCGLNSTGMTYRRKSVDQVMDELTELSRRHEVLRFSATDNIMDHASMEELCQRLACSGNDFDIFYEVKANLSKRQINQLRAAGIRFIQPGIESLSTHVLTLMRKGSTKLVNVRLLKWAAQAEIDVAWNVLMGFPGETIDDYRGQADLMELLHHLQPPGHCGGLWLERFSPYFEQPELGFTNPRPISAYRMVYPLADMDIDGLAYFFDYDVRDVVPHGDREVLVKAVDRWRTVHGSDRKNSPVLRAFRGPGWLRIMDTRTGRLEKTTLRGADAALMNAIDETFHNATAIERILADTDTPMNAADITQRLDALVERRFVVHDDGYYLSIVLPIVGALSD
jgi:ribosomal peptide maturation radical SAM protein 1